MQKTKKALVISAHPRLEFSIAETNPRRLVIEPMEIPECNFEIDDIPGPWAIARTSSNRERAFALECSRRRLAYFLPLTLRASGVLSPLLAGFVFVSMRPAPFPIAAQPSTQQLLSWSVQPEISPSDIKRTSPNIFGWIIPNSTSGHNQLQAEIKLLAMDTPRNRQLVSHAEFHKGDPVRISEGFYAGFLANFGQYIKHGRVLVELKTFGQIVSLKLPRELIEAASVEA